MTSKDCCLLSIIIIFFIILFTILLIWLNLKPAKPRFIFQDITVNISGNPSKLLISDFQITLTSRNPYGIEFYYDDGLRVYATVNRSQQITLRTLITPTYQGPKEFSIREPFIYATSVPVALGLENDQDVMVMIHADGRVTYRKARTFFTGKYHLSVRCSAFINFGNKTAGFIVVGDNAFRYSVTKDCSVSF